MNKGNAKLELLDNFWKRVKRWFLTDTKTKIWVFLFTLIVFIYTILSNDYNYSFSSRLEIRNIKEGKILKSNVPKKIVANFTGRGMDMIYLKMTKKSNFKFVVDVGNIRQCYDFHLTQYFLENPDKIIKPRGTNLRFNHVVYPETVHVELYTLSNAKVPIVPRIEIQESAGYIKVGKPVVIPDSTFISGPKGDVDKCSALYTEAIHLNNVSIPFERDVKLELNNLSNVDVPIKTVRVIQKVEQISEKIIFDILVIIRNAPHDAIVELSPSSVSITVMAGVSVIKNLKREDITVSFDLAKQWKSDQKLYIPEVKLPDGIISWKNMTPKEIEVRVFREGNL